MAKKGNGLAYTARLNVKEAIANAKLLKKELGSMGIDVSKGFDTKPMTEFQKAQIQIKQEALEFAKQKAEQARADRAASLATQQALREERELIKQRNAEAAKRKPNISDSAPEVAAYNLSTSGTSGSVNTAFTTYLKEVKKDFDSGKISAKEYVAELERYSSVSVQNSNTTKQATAQVKQLSLSKKELAQDLAIEKLKQQEATAALKNNAREMLNAKGSLENRRAALIRLTAAYDRLGKSEQATPAGKRLGTIVENLSKSIGELELKTNRGQRNVGQYTNAFAAGANKAWGALKQLANLIPGLGLAGIFAVALDPLMDYIKGLDLFKSKLSQAKVAQADMAKALEGSEYAKAVTNVNELRINIDLAKQGLISKESVLKQYNETIGKTTGQVKSLDQAEQELNKNADAFIKVTLLKAAAQVALESAAKSAYEAEISRRKKLEEFSSITDNFGPGNLEGINTVTGEVDEKKRAARQARILKQREEGRKKEVKISQDAANQQIAIAKKFQEDAATISKKSGFVNFLGNSSDPKTVVKSIQSQINAQRTLQSEIDALTNKGRAKQLTNDEQELADVDAKYKKLYEKAKNFNDLVAEYNANPKNKNKRQAVNTSGLLLAQSTEEDALRDKQAAAKLKINIDAQKKVYEDFEQFKTKIGEAGADQRFAKELGSAKTYLEYLRQQEAALLPDDKAKGGDGGGQVNDLQLKEIRDKIKEEVALNKKKDDDIFAYAYQAAETYNQRLTAIEVDYNLKRKALGESATSDQLAQLQLEKDERIRSANLTNSQQQAGYAKLMMNYDAMTRGAIVKRLEAIREGYRKEYKEGKLTAEQLKQLVDGINGQLGNLNGNNAFKSIVNSIKNYRDALKSLPSDSIGVKEAQSDMFGSIANGAADASAVIGDVANSLSELGIGGEGLQDALKGVQGIMDGAGSIAKGIASGNPVDIVTGSIKLLTSAIQLFNVKDKKLEKQIQGYKDQLDSLGNAYKQLERDVQNSVGESIYSDQAAQIENLKNQQIALTKARDAERSKKKADQGKIDEFQNQIDAIPGQIEDIQKAIGQSLIQTTFKDLANALSDAFVEAFSAGEDAAGRFDVVFKKVIANAISNSLKLKILDPVVKKFTDDLTAYASTNGNSVIGFDFDAYKKQLKDAGDLFTAGLKGSEEFFKDVANAASGATPTAVTGVITSAGLTEDSANKAMGTWRGTFDNTKMINLNVMAGNKINSDIYAIATQNLSLQVKIEANTLRAANNTDNLEAILKKIDNNTSSGSSYQSLLNGGVKS